MPLLLPALVSMHTHIHTNKKRENPNTKLIANCPVMAANLFSYLIKSTYPLVSFTINWVVLQGNKINPEVWLMASGDSHLPIHVTLPMIYITSHHLHYIMRLRLRESMFLLALDGASEDIL